MVCCFHLLTAVIDTLRAYKKHNTLQNTHVHSDRYLLYLLHKRDKYHSINGSKYTDIKCLLLNVLLTSYI